MILVVLYVAYKYVWPKVSAGLAGGAQGGGRTGTSAKKPAGRTMG